LKPIHQSRSQGGAGATEARGRFAGPPVAVIDVGSNSVRLVMYERLSRAPTVLFNEKVLAGLGRGIASTGRLLDEATETALSAIERFKALLDHSGVEEVDILATAAARDAENGPAFIAAVEKITGRKVQLLSGADEARLSALGVISGFIDANGVTGDLGGGSLELVDIRKGEIGKGRTFPLGGIRLEEAAKGSIREAELIVAEALKDAASTMSCFGRPFYAVGGTWRALARLHMFDTDHPLHVMHHYAVPAGEMLEFSRMVAHRDPETLEGIEAVSKPRRKLLPFGALVMEQVLRLIRPSEVHFSALGVREGHLYTLLSPEEQARDPLIEGCAEFNLLRSRSPQHGVELIDWTANVFAALGVDETPEERRLRVAACLVSDVSWRGHPDYRGEQSLNLIANSAMIGIDHPGRAYISLASYYRHVGLVDDEVSPVIVELCDARYRERARLAGSAFRVAYILSASMAGIISRSDFERRGNRLVLRLPEDLGALGGERLRKRLNALAKLGGCKEGVIEVYGGAYSAAAANA
jgi:exopolyphosphatase/guanosine-5'-triphosphate,3'-diphosphate pyrophosphatase